jgi:hypothetical protein
VFAGEIHLKYLILAASRRGAFIQLNDKVRLFAKNFTHKKEIISLITEEKTPAAFRKGWVFLFLGS